MDSNLWAESSIRRYGFIHILEISVANPFVVDFVPKKQGIVSKKPSKISKELTKAIDASSFDTYASIRCAGKSLKTKSSTGLAPSWVKPTDDMKLRIPMLVEEIEFQFFDVSFFVCDGSVPPEGHEFPQPLGRLRLRLGDYINQHTILYQHSQSYDIPSDYSSCVGTVHIKFQYCTQMILSSLPYGNLEKLITSPNYEIMRSLVRLSRNADICSVYSILSIFFENGCILPFLEETIKDYFRIYVDEPDTGFFREDSFYSSLIEQFLLKISEPYLTKTLMPFLERIMNDKSCPANVSADKLEAEQVKLLEQYCSNLIEIILGSSKDFPVEGKHLFQVIRKQLALRGHGAVTYKVIGSMFFLRLLSPCLISPTKFQFLFTFQNMDAHSVNTNLLYCAKFVQRLSYTIDKGDESQNEMKENLCKFLDSISLPSEEEIRKMNDQAMLAAAMLETPSVEKKNILARLADSGGEKKDRMKKLNVKMQISSRPPVALTATRSDGSQHADKTDPVSSGDKSGSEKERGGLMSSDEMSGAKSDHSGTHSNHRSVKREVKNTEMELGLDAMRISVSSSAIHDAISANCSQTNSSPSLNITNATEISSPHQTQSTGELSPVITITNPFPDNPNRPSSPSTPTTTTRSDNDSSDSEALSMKYFQQQALYLLPSTEEVPIIQPTFGINRFKLKGLALKTIANNHSDFLHFYCVVSQTWKCIPNMELIKDKGFSQLSSRLSTRILGTPTKKDFAVVDSVYDMSDDSKHSDASNPAFRERNHSDPGPVVNVMKSSNPWESLDRDSDAQSSQPHIANALAVHANLVSNAYLGTMTGSDPTSAHHLHVHGSATPPNSEPKSPRLDAALHPLGPQHTGSSPLAFSSSHGGTQAHSTPVSSDSSSSSAQLVHGGVHLMSSSDALGREHLSSSAGLSPPPLKKHTSPKKIPSIRFDALDRSLTHREVTKGFQMSYIKRLLDIFLNELLQNAQSSHDLFALYCAFKFEMETLTHIEDKCRESLRDTFLDKKGNHQKTQHSIAPSRIVDEPCSQKEKSANKHSSLGKFRDRSKSAIQ